MISMKMTEPITLAILSSQVEKWMNKTENIRLECMFKYPINVLSAIQIEKIKKIMIYACHQQMHTFFTSPEPNKAQKIKILAQQIQSYYYEMNMNSIWKQNFYFQFSLVYLVKLISSFCNSFFKWIQIDTKFESQIFIILVHIFLGTNVGHKSFKILEKKFIGKSTLKNKKRKLNVKQSKQEEINCSEFYDKDSINMHGDDFKSDLKSSLYVRPLPKLQIKRKSLQSFNVANNSLERYQMQEKMNEIQETLKKKSMKSTQLSSSMSMTLKKYNSFVSMHNKPFKISNRLPFDGGLKIFNNKENCLNANEDTLINKSDDEKQSSKIPSQEWLKIVVKMKDSIIQENAKMENNTVRPNKDKRLSEDEREYRESSSLNKVNKDCKTQDGFGLIKKIPSEKVKRQPIENKVGRSYEIEQLSENQKQKKLILPNSKELKSMKRSFDEMCQIRGQKISYTIFTLPGIKHHHKIL